MSDESERELTPETEGPELEIDPEEPESPHEATAAEPNDEGEDAASEPAPKLQRLQKILAQAGVASRRHAEELITGGHVQINGQTVTVLGTKADAARDHIRVDGKLLHGAERLRYFMLNKPRGHVTTVSDPEGRPTVMEFFSKMGERLYPVGRLDYLSEGLLLVTNDGELANALTKASSGVEKTYLVKVAGQPTEDELDVLRGGVSIDRGKPGAGKVQTAAARIRQVRQGDNPWYEVVLIEGRNRELRKMFEEIGHFVEKIRRVGYGPLVLDLEPGKVRELDPDEVEALRLTAAGKLKPRKPKVKDSRLRKAMDAQLPTLAPRPSRKPFVKPPPAEPAAPGEASAFKPRAFRPSGDKAGKFGAGEFRPKKAFGAEKFFGAGKSFSAGKRFGTDRAGSENAKPFRPAAARPRTDRAATGRPATGSARFGAGRPSARPPFNPDRPAARPAWKKDDRPSRPPARESRSGGERSFGAKPAWKKPSGDRPAFKRPAPPPDMPEPAADFVRRPSRLRIEAADADTPRPARTGPPRPRPAFDRPKPAFDRAKPAIDRPKPAFDRPKYDRPRTSRPGTDRPPTDRPKFERSGPGGPRFSGAKTGGPRYDRPKFGGPKAGGPRSDKPRFDRPASARPKLDRPSFDRPSSARPQSDRPSFDRPRTDRPGKPARGFSAGAARPSGPRTGSGPSRPARSGGLARPFTTSSGVPRPGGARPSNKHGKPAGKSFGKGAGKPAFGSKSKSGGPKTGGGKSFGAKSGGFKKTSGFKSGPKKGGGSSFKGRPKPGGKGGR